MLLATNAKIGTRHNISDATSVSSKISLYLIIVFIRMASYSPRDKGCHPFSEFQCFTNLHNELNIKDNSKLL